MNAWKEVSNFFFNSLKKAVLVSSRSFVNLDFV